MINFFLQNLIWTEGYYILLVSIIISFLLFFINPRLVIISLLFIGFSLYFFRNPERSINNLVANTTEFIIAPCDGKVIDIKQEFDKNLNRDVKKISIFLSPFDVHVNWIPVDGKILSVNYKTGKFVFAYQPKSSELNERNDVLIDSSCSKMILVRQIAGMLARRIVCWVKQGDEVKMGQKFGMIKFSSRVELFIEEPVDLNIEVGQKLIGGETLIGKWSC